MAEGRAGDGLATTLRHRSADHGPAAGLGTGSEVNLGRRGLMGLSPATADLVIASLLLGGLYVTVSIGLSLVFGVMRVMNFAHGEFIMLAMYAVYWAYEAAGIDPYVAGLLVVPVIFLV